MKNNNITWFLLFLIVVALALLSAPLWASGDCNGQGNCTEDITSIDASSAITNKGSSSWGIGSGGPGDVDINGCWGSTQFGVLTFFKQRLVTIETCLGFEFLRLGHYDIAAMHFCNDKATLEEYTSESECENAHDFTPPEPEKNNSTADGMIRSEQTYELAYQQQEEEIEYLQEENASIVGRLDDLTAKLDRAPEPAPVQQQAPPQYTDEQINAVWAALGIEDEDDE